MSNGGERQPLAIFPNAQAIGEAERARDAVHAQAEQLKARVLELNRVGHDLLFAPDILPAPGDRVFEYRKAYVDFIQRQFPAMLNAVAPPSMEEIKAAADTLHDQEVEQKIVVVAGKEANRDQLECDFQETVRRLPDQLRKERATRFSVYMEPGAVSVSKPMYDPNRKPLPSDIWYAQLGIWIQSDVARAITSANSTVVNGNILTNPVKRIVRIDVADGPAAYVMKAGAAPAAADDDGSGRDYSRLPSGHYSNSQYDVIQYTLTLDVDQRFIPLIVNELQRNQLTTVNGVNVVGIDQTNALTSGYLYGNAPMVQVVLNCDTLYFRQWTVPLMPEEVKLDLRIPATDATAAAAPVAPAPAKKH